MNARTEQVTVSGKFLRLGADKFYVKGFSYGPFAPNSNGDALPEPRQLDQDFRQIREIGANTIRVYFPPPLWLLDKALEHDLKVFVDVPWEKHRCFLEDWSAMERARAIVRQTAKLVGAHPAVLAISVANELPADAVRFQGRCRVERFLRELLDSSKQEAPDCLNTFVNFPMTEFLNPDGQDFCCFNVYVHDEAKFGAYLDRLQHIAGNRPLLLGEYGIDSVREGDIDQAAILTRHVRRVFRHGLAGSVVFAYTDDWFTGGHQIENWFFGVTTRERKEKLAATALRNAWKKVPYEAANDLPKVSVIVCSYNGAKTLRACLDSLARLDYPDFEVILVDDGSTDDTQEIAGDYPQVIYHHQPNRGLSAARNVGAQLASGEVVAYTDSDCEVDEDWLTYLVQAMQDQDVEAIGGPNITPTSDGWIAKCVAASPGNPSHVMLDDHHAEHVPGCNMAFFRATLLGLGGFDTQFRAAGDDVDMCWRMLDAGMRIGYAPGAMVWHHRRATLRAFAKQQQGYGRSEAMIHFKHPQRCGVFGRSSWKGIIYGDGAVGLPLLPDQIYHGSFGGGLFQTIYRHNHYGLWSVLMSLEWHLVALFLLMLATLFWPLALVSGLMWCATGALALRSAMKAPLPTNISRWCRLVVAYLYAMQPIWRGWYRLTHVLKNKRLPKLAEEKPAEATTIKFVSATVRDLYWESDEGYGREQLLPELVRQARSAGWAGDFDNGWAEWDVKLVGDRWHDITIYTATEELGWPRRFTRARCIVPSTMFSRILGTAAIIWTIASIISLEFWAILFAAIACTSILVKMIISRRRCLRAAVILISRAATVACQPASAEARADPDFSYQEDSSDFENASATRRG